MKNTDWIKGAVIYQIYPDSFAKSATGKPDGIFEKWDAPETPQGFKGGNLQGAAEKLDYLRGLGVSVIYFNPIFASCANHRYHTHDYFNVDPVLGGNEAFDAFVAEAHKRGIKIILDGVFNHASRGFFQFNHILENGAHSPYRKWFHIGGYPVKAYNLPDGDKPNYHCWWGLPALPKFNTKNPEVRKFILSVAAFWLKRGIDGWRLDVPYEINDDSFWREFRQTCKKINPGCYITGEVWGDGGRWLKGDQFDAVMNYRLSAPCIAYFGGEKLQLSRPYAGKKLKAIDQKAFMADIENLLASYRWDVTLRQMNMMSSHDTDRMADTYGYDKARIELAAVFSFLFPGAINIYYGEEIGLRGKIDQGSRRGMPWDKKKLWDKDLLGLYRALGALRADNPVIRDGKFSFLREYCDGTTLAFRRTLGGRSITCYMNCSGSAAELAVASAGKTLISEGANVSTEGGVTVLDLGPRAFVIMGE